MKLADERSSPEWFKRMRELTGPIGGPASYNHFPCPACKARSNTWCRNEIGGMSCQARFDLWARAGRPFYDGTRGEHFTPLKEAMLLAAYGEAQQEE